MPADPSPLLSIPDLASRLATSERQIRDLVYRRRIPFVKVGRLVRFRPEAIERWLNDATVDPWTPHGVG